MYEHISYKAPVQAYQHIKHNWHKLSINVVGSVSGAAGEWPDQKGVGQNIC